MVREIDVTEFPGILPKLSDPRCLRPGEYLCSGITIESEREAELRTRMDAEKCPRYKLSTCRNDYHCIPAYHARIAALEGQIAEREAVAQNGHPNPCTLGALCPYCEIERQKARAESAETALAAARAENAQIRAIIDEVFGPFQVGTATHVRACVEQLQADLAAARSDAVREFAEWLLRGGPQTYSREYWDMTAARYLSSLGVPSARPDDGRVELERQLAGRAQIALSQMVGLHYVVAWPELTARVEDVIQAAADGAERGGR
jgi:hypothetical protein